MGFKGNCGGADLTLIPLVFTYVSERLRTWITSPFRAAGKHELYQHKKDVQILIRWFFQIQQFTGIHAGTCRTLEYYADWREYKTIPVLVYNEFMGKMAAMSASSCQHYNPFTTFHFRRWFPRNCHTARAH